MDAAVRPGSATGWVLAAAGLDILGARVARRHGLIGEPLLVGPPRFVPAPLTTVVWGTALSGPLLIDAALLALTPAVAGGKAIACRVVRAGGVVRLAGVLAEPVAWGRRRPRRAMLVAAAQLVVAAGLIGAGRVPAPLAQRCTSVS
jgi:hypothetical protein